MIPSPMLVKLGMRYVYLGPYMNATNATTTNGHVTAAFWITLVKFDVR